MKQNLFAEEYKKIFREEEYIKKISELQKKNLLTPHEEVAYLVRCIQKTKPKVIYEIGTFFGQTTEILAQALHENGEGELYTTDPYGGERCPKIISEFPENFQKRVHYFPYSSMDMFAHLQAVFKNDTFLDLTFIDGCHEFEHALFDLISTSSKTTPGGCIVIDNLENKPTCLALEKFIGMFPFWKCMINGEYIDNLSLQKKIREIKKQKKICWGVLISPQENLIGNLGKKFTKKFENILPAGLEISFANTQSGQNVFCEIKRTYVPYDFHLTGNGMFQENPLSFEYEIGREKTKINIQLKQKLSTIFSQGYWLVELEIYPSGPEQDALLVLEKDNPVKIF